MEPASVVIRPCTRTDLAAVEDRYREFAALHAALAPSFVMAPEAPELFGRYLGDQLSGDQALVLVADVGEVVGVALGQLRSRPPVYPEVGFVPFLEQLYRLVE